MAISTNDVWRRIEAEAIASAQERSEWASQAFAAAGNREFKDGLQLLKTLIGLGRLTHYQARVLAGKTTGLLRKGDWIILGPVLHPMWQEWWILKAAPLRNRLSRFDDSSDLSWGRWLSAEDIAGLERSYPSVDRANALAGIGSDLIHPIAPLEIRHGQLLVRLSPASDQPIYQQIAETAPQDLPVEKILLRTAQALANLHSHGIVHGRVAPDRILWDGQQRSSLLCDPLCCLSCMPDRSAEGLLGGQIPNSRMGAFIAPELSVQPPVPTFCTDVYCLGATWRWLVSLQPQAQSRLERPIQACLRRCLAKAPEDRYPNAIELVDDLKTVYGKEVEPHRPVAVVPAESQIATAAIAGSETARPGAVVRVGQSGKRPIVRAKKKSWPMPLLALIGAAMLVLPLVGWIAYQLSTSGTDENAAPPIANGRLQSGSKVDPARNPADDPANDSVSDLASAHRHNQYEVVESDQALWAPPLNASPIGLELLPPGAQLAVAFRPGRLRDNQWLEGAAAVLQQDPLWLEWSDRLIDQAGVPVESVERATITFYGSIDGGQDQALPWGSMTNAAIRIELNVGLPLEELLSAWGISETQQGDSVDLLLTGTGRGYCIPTSEERKGQVEPAQHSRDGMSGRLVQRFSVGPEVLMRDVLELRGGDSFLTPPLQRLRERSSSQYDVCILASPRYLTGDRLTSQQWVPDPFQELFQTAIGGDARAILVQAQIGPSSYWEVQLIPGLESDSISAGRELQQEAGRLGGRVEQWLVRETPHAYWRALALRLPQMLRFCHNYSRFGIENGVVIANGYVPGEAVSNLVTAFWMMLRDQSLGAARRSPPPAATATQPSDNDAMTDDLLRREIRILFDQESIEEALALISEAANEGISDEARRIRFDLDSAAFEQAGITRNQQIRDFQISNQPLRVALTELVRRGNPIPNVQDLRQPEQQLIWVVKEDAQMPGRRLVLLTTRMAAKTDRIPLPDEFSSVNE